jgi:formylglycine-generating enzyme required for sulfatase activity
MGTDRNAGRSGPVHAVKIAKPFYMGKFPVTQAQYQRVVGANPSRQKGDDLPVGRVPIAGIEGFCQKTSKTTGAAIRLPTEAEWEFACRAGTWTKYYNGDAENDLDKAAWYENNSGGNVQPVGKKQPNPFGLHDMLGNTWEMCEDDWQYGYRNAAADGSAFKNNPRSDRRVIRGGTERLGAELTTCAHRSGTDTAGFRVVVTAQQAGD